MGYFLTTSPENAVPQNSCASLKTHTPDSRVKERGLRYFMPEIGRWPNRDPLEELGLQEKSASANGSPVERHEIIVDQIGPSRTSFISPASYVFCRNDSILYYDLIGLSEMCSPAGYPQPYWHCTKGPYCTTVPGGLFYKWKVCTAYCCLDAIMTYNCVNLEACPMTRRTYTTPVPGYCQWYVYFYPVPKWPKIPGPVI